MPRMIPLQDYVIVQPVSIGPRELESGLVAPETEKRLIWHGKVLGVGNGRHTEFGTFIVPECVVGDLVLYDIRVGVPFPVDNEVCVVLRSCDVIAKIEESPIVTVDQILSQ